MSRPMSTSPAASQPGLIDPLIESMIDFSDYDSVPYQSPSLSPATSNKTPFARPVKTENTTPSLLSTTQPLSGPSHQYDLYKQQTGMVPGALASTLAVSSTPLLPGYTDFGADYLGLGNTDDVFDFNAAPSQASMSTPDMDMEFDSPSGDPSFFFDSTTVNPSSLGGQEPSGLSSPQMMSTPTSSVGRLWPGMHQQAAMAKAQAQAQAQAQQQQRQRAQAKQAQRPKSAQPSDPIVEQKITQLLNSMRNKASMDDGSQGMPHLNISRPKKDEEDMDEDERLLASEEGKKLSSKERRQLRNKVSARAFRSRRKEYITQLEAEIANKVTENGTLRTENRALAEENKRLSDLTRMLLSSPSFSDFLDRLSSNPQQVPQPQQQQPPQQQQQETNRQVPKDVNPYTAQQQMQHQHISLAMIPEQNMDFSMLTMDASDTFNYQPQVFSVLETPEPTLDAAILSGKSSNIVDEQFDSEEEKVEMPVIERPAVVEEEVAPTVAPIDEKFESDPAFALYHDSPVTETTTPVELDTDGLSNIDIFGGIEPEKVLARFELVDASEEDATAALAMARVQRISANLESVMARLESLTVGL
ncbi:hypothetical protein B0T16DRAFT_432055 [Cercophora newfieldiana]|uniref:BZIP domain-containing protein n=1 Tax=Cercophora newfieldiana TaxID=92897 RepID=A0AA39XST4_9PEZI|nr:hypothetical protein B0T16DRAFT_432055 [Cercophora newfieldiana]